MTMSTRHVLRTFPFIHIPVLTLWSNRCGLARITPLAWIGWICDSPTHFPDVQTLFSNNDQVGLLASISVRMCIQNNKIVLFNIHKSSKYRPTLWNTKLYTWKYLIYLKTHLKTLRSIFNHIDFLWKKFNILIFYSGDYNIAMVFLPSHPIYLSFLFKFHDFSFYSLLVHAEATHLKMTA